MFMLIVLTEDSELDASHRSLPHDAHTRSARLPENARISTERTFVIIRRLTVTVRDTTDFTIGSG